MRKRIECKSIHDKKKKTEKSDKEKKTRRRKKHKKYAGKYLKNRRIKIH